MPKKTHVKKNKKGRVCVRKKKQSKTCRKVQKKSVARQADKVLVSRRKVPVGNLLDLKDGKVDGGFANESRIGLANTIANVDDDEANVIANVDDANVVANDGAGGLKQINTDFTSGESVNFVVREKRINPIVNLLAGLPGDFIFFYKGKLKVLLHLVQMGLEMTGRFPFLLVLGLLSLLEHGVIRPIFRLIFSFIRGGFYFWRHVLANLFWIFKNGFLEIIYFPRNFIWWLKPEPQSNWGRSVLAFMMVCLAIVLPFGTYTHIVKLKNTEGKVLGVATQAYEHLQIAQAATSELDFEAAGEAFRQADDNFLAAQQELGNLNFLISGIINNLPAGMAAQRLLEAGQAIAEAGTHITEALSLLSDGISSNDIDDGNSNTSNTSNISNDLASSPQVDFDILSEGEADVVKVELGVGEKIKILQEKFAMANPLVVLARKNFSEVDPDILPEDKRDNFSEIGIKIAGLEAVCKKLFSFSRIISELLGTQGSRRYLIVFQNEDEIRPGGGFMGSFALMDVRDGEIEQIEVPGGGPYDLQGSLIKRVIPPKPLQLVSSQWQMQDANWFADFPTSAQKIMWFYENSGGSTVDGVVAITSGLVPEFLELTGPIEMPKYDKIITADNFQLETQMAVEVEYDREENRPKKFIADLMPKVIEKLVSLPSEKAIDLLGVVDLGLSGRKILFYFSDEEIQEEARLNNWAGEIKEVGEQDDFLLVVNANIGGKKTDGVIDEKIVHETEVLEDGGLVDTVTIIRTHNGGVGYFFANERNVDYIRLYAPEGSVLLEAKGFRPLDSSYFKELTQGLMVDEDLKKIEGQVLIDEATGTRISNEFGKTVFGNWAIVDPGETVILKIKYRLPYRFNLYNDNLYTLLIQKQAGSKEDEIEKIILLPDGVGLSWKYPEGEFVGESNGLVKFRGNLDMDKYYGILFR